MEILVKYCMCSMINRTGCLVIATFKLAYCIILTAVSVGFISHWKDVDIRFLIEKSSTNRSFQHLNEASIGENLTNFTEFENNFNDDDRESQLAEIGAVWEKELISAYCILPWYGLINVLLMIAAVKEIRAFLVVWLVATVFITVWEFLLLAILMAYNLAVKFILTLSILNLLNFFFTSMFLLVVFSFYQELTFELVNGTQIKSIDYIEREAGAHVNRKSSKSSKSSDSSSDDD